MEKCKLYKWHLLKIGYVCATVSKNNHIFLHRYLLNLTTNDKVDVDHIDGNPLNNRKINLRIGTHQQNCFNNKIAINNTSEFTGVYFREDRNKWVAYIHNDYKTIVLGHFDTKEEAILERFKAEKEIYKEYSPIISRSIKI